MDQVESFNAYTRQSTQNLKEGTRSTLDRLLQTDKMGEELNSTISEMRRSYGTELRNLSPGDHFGEVALLLTHSLSPNTVMSNDPCQLLVVGKETFHKYLATHLQSALLKRAYFVANHHLFDGWTLPFIRQLGVALRERKLKFEDILFQEEKDSRCVYFIKSGTLKLSASSNRRTPRDLINRTSDSADCFSYGTGQPSTRKQRMRRLSLRSSASQSHLSSSSSSLSSAPSTSKLHTKKSSTKKHYRLHEPLPSSGVHVCILGPGDILGDIEAICQLKHSLFTAVSMGRTTVYELDVCSFHYLLMQKHLGTLHTLVGDLLQRTAEWEARLPALSWLGHVTRALHHVFQCLEGRRVGGKGMGGRGANRRSREAKYPPDAVAMAAIKVSTSKASRDVISSQDSLEDLVQGQPRDKLRLHPFDSPPPPPCDLRTAANLMPILPCAYATKQPAVKLKEGLCNPSSRKGWSPNRMTVFDLEDVDHIEIETEMAIAGNRTPEEGVNPNLHLAFIPHSTSGVKSGMQECDVKNRQAGSGPGQQAGSGPGQQGPLGLTRHAWGSLEGGAHSHTPIPAAEVKESTVYTDLSPCSRYALEYALESDGPMEVCTAQPENHLEHSTNSIEPTTNGPSPPSCLFPAIQSVARQQCAHPPHRPVCSPLQTPMKSPHSGGQYVEQPPHTSQPHTTQPHTTQPHTSQPHTTQPHTTQPHTTQPHTTQPHTTQPHTTQPHTTQPHTTQPHTIQPPISLDTPKSSSNHFQVLTLVEAAPKRTIGTPPQRPADTTIDDCKHWRLPDIPQPSNMLPSPGTPQPLGTYHRPLDTLCCTMDCIQSGQRPADQEPSTPPHTVEYPDRQAMYRQVPSALCPSSAAGSPGPPSATGPPGPPSATGPLGPPSAAGFPGPPLNIDPPGTPLTADLLGPPLNSDPFGSPICLSVVDSHESPLAAGPSSPSPSHSADDANTDTTISAMWEVPINVFMREATPGRSGDPDAARVDPRPYSRMHTQQKGGLGTGRAPSSPHAYLQSRAQSYPLHHLLSRMGVARPQQWIQPHHSIIDLSFDQARGKAGVPQDKAADSVSEFRPITRFCTEEGNGLGVITIFFFLFFFTYRRKKNHLAGKVKKPSGSSTGKY